MRAVASLCAWAPLAVGGGGCDSEGQGRGPNRLLNLVSILEARPGASRSA
jgi:hypothetical protein